MKIKEINKNNRPRERLQNSGPESLSDAEILALIIQSGTKNLNAIDLSNKILNQYSINELSKLTITELTKIKGIGKAKATKILAAFELSSRNTLTSKIIKEPVDIYNHYKHLESKTKEHFYTILLDSKNNIIKKELISIGTLNSSLVHPREVFNPAIKHNANSIILIHNHPSGDPTPSKEDIKVTKVLKKTGDLLNIKVIDHIIIGKDNYKSIFSN